MKTEETVSNKPKRPIAECAAEFTKALEANDFDTLDRVEKELDGIVYTRLRRMSYKGYRRTELDKLISDLPVDYNGKAMEKVFKIMDNLSPVHSV